MMAGSLDTESVLWVVGEATGKTVAGATAAIPKNEDFTVSGQAILDELNFLEAKLTASGVMPAL